MKWTGLQEEESRR